MFLGCFLSFWHLVFLMNEKGGFVAFTTLPRAFIPVIIIMRISMKTFKDEITARSLLIKKIVESMVGQIRYYLITQK